MVARLVWGQNGPDPKKMTKDIEVPNASVSLNDASATAVFGQAAWTNADAVRNDCMIDTNLFIIVLST
eukprot:CAMPEP_0171981552 /NCGR_PEP_ID=MMETSP0993-20121228/266954_1 /TAXON_ID=483369 /ORGANISM="non described non described, Strain CCMP2098" /LENGTH=67 /DNA_ID=CAMNT_0012634005 /DNA_START=50 /DNA_END=249 /DNA_ORIENTATION=+